MHIRNLSETIIENYEKSAEDNGENLGIKSIMETFWDNEHELLKQKTFREKVKLVIETTFSNATMDGGNLILLLDNETLEEEYMEVENLQDDMIEYIEDEINISNYEILEKEYALIKLVVNRCWQKSMNTITSPSPE